MRASALETLSEPATDSSLIWLTERSPDAFSGFKDGQSPRSARGYDLLALTISTPTSLNRNDVTSSDPIDLVTPQNDANHTGFIATTSGGD